MKLRRTKTVPFLGHPVHYALCVTVYISVYVSFLMCNYGLDRHLSLVTFEYLRICTRPTRKFV